MKTHNYVRMRQKKGPFWLTDSHPHVFFSENSTSGVEFLGEKRCRGTVLRKINQLTTLLMEGVDSAGAEISRWKPVFSLILPYQQSHSTCHHSMMTSNTHYCAVTHLLHRTLSMQDVDNVCSYLCMFLSVLHAAIDIIFVRSATIWFLSF